MKKKTTAKKHGAYRENDRHDGVRSDTKYAHNPNYCMILPDAREPDEEDISSTGQS